MNTKASSDANANSHKTLRGGLFGTRYDVLLLGIGACLVLLNVVVFLGVDTRPSNWLFYLNVRFWSFHVAVILWATAIWLVTELTDILEYYLPAIRMVTVICILFAIIFGLQSSFGTEGAGNSLWFYTVVVVAFFCALRSLFLLYQHRYGEDNSFDLEEAQWFWGMSGFLFVVLIIIGLMCIIQVKIRTALGIDAGQSISLISSCRNDLQTLIESGSGSFAIRALGLLIIAGSIAFVYVTGKWALIFLTRIKEGWE